MTTEISTELLTAEQITALLQGGGFVPSEQGSGVNRIKVNGTTFEAGDEVYISNPKTKAPAFIALLTQKPRQYQARYFDPEDRDDEALLNMMNRPHLMGTFCKSFHDDPSQAREKNENGDSCRSCLINPFVPKAKVPAEANGKKCKWRGEFYLRILDGERKVIDDTVYLLDVSTTGMIEWEGISSNREKGYVSPLNSMHRLALLGQSRSPSNPTAGIYQALSALDLGGVIVEVRAVPQSSNGNNYSVVSFNPIDIIDTGTEPATTGIETAEVADDVDDIPF